MVRIPHHDAGDLLRLQLQLACPVPAEVRVGGRDAGRHEGRELLLPLSLDRRAGVQVDLPELRRVGLGERDGKQLRRLAARYAGPGRAGW